MKGEKKKRERHVTQCPLSFPSKRMYYVAQSHEWKVTMRLRHKRVMRHSPVRSDDDRSARTGIDQKWEQNDGLELLLEVSLNVCVL